MPVRLRRTPSVLAAMVSLAAVCLAAPARAQVPAAGAAPAPGYAPVQQPAPPPSNPYAQPGGGPPPNQYPPPNPPPPNYGYGQPAYPVQQSPYPPPGYGYPPPVTSPVPPLAQAPERFGRRGQIVLTQGFGIISHSENTSQVRLNPALSFFVANNFSVGVDATFDYTSYEGPRSSSKSLGIGLTLGGNIPMGSALSLWPTLRNAFWAPDFGSNYGSTTITFPLLIHVAQHFFIAAGPELFMYRFLSGSETDLHFTQSLATFIGGWW